MNNNSNQRYEDYMNSYGVKEIQREARQARMLKDATSNMPGVKKSTHAVLRFAPTVIVIALLLFRFLG